MLTLPLLCLVMVGPVPLAIAVSRHSGAPSTATKTMIVLVVTLWLHQLVALTLGTFGILEFGPVIALEILLLLIGLWLIRGTGKPTTSARPDYSMTALGGSLLAVGAVATWLALVLPTRNFDSLEYHLPTLAHWARTGAFSELEFMGATRLYPFGWEAISLLFAVAAQQDLAVALPNLVAWVLLILSVRGLARLAGAHPIAASFAGAMAGMLPVVLERLDAMQPDIALGALFTTSLVLVSQGVARRSGWLTAIGAISVSLLPGLKASGIAYATLVVLVGLALRFRSLGDARESRLVAPRWLNLAVLVGCLFVGAFWWTRNLQLAGNPFGDVRLTLFGRDFLDGALDPSFLAQTSLARVFRLQSAEHWETLRANLWQQLGAPLTILLGTTVVARVVTTPERGRFPRTWLALLVLATTALYVVTPYSAVLTPGDDFDRWSAHGVRYAMPAWCVLGALLGSLIGNVKFLPRWIAGVCVGLALWSTNRVFGMPLHFAAVLLAVSVATILYLPRMGRGVPALAVGLALVTLTVANPARVEGRRQVFGNFYVALERHIPPHATVASYGVSQPYFLYGRTLRRDVRMRPFDQDDLTTWESDPDRWRSELRGWLAAMTSEESPFLVVPHTEMNPLSRGRTQAVLQVLESDRNWMPALEAGDPLNLRLYAPRGWQPGQ